MSVTILAQSRDDFERIREEVKKMQQQYNHLLAESGYELIYRNRPYDQEKQAIAFAANWEPDVKAARRQRIIIFVILLLVPAINLSSMTQSRLRQRVDVYKRQVCNYDFLVFSVSVGQDISDNVYTWL